MSDQYTTFKGIEDLIQYLKLLVVNNDKIKIIWNEKKYDIVKSDKNKHFIKKTENIDSMMYIELIIIKEKKK